MSHSIDETYDVYEETVYRARKLHECDACDLPIKPGDFYCRVFILFDGRKETVKRCGACQKTHEHLRKLDPGELWPDERLDCGLEYEREWNREPPEEIAALPMLSDAERGALREGVAVLNEPKKTAKKKKGRR